MEMTRESAFLTREAWKKRLPERAAGRASGFQGSGVKVTRADGHYLSGRNCGAARRVAHRWSFPAAAGNDHRTGVSKVGTPEGVPG